MSFSNQCPVVITDDGPTLDSTVQSFTKGHIERASRLIWKQLDSNPSEDEVAELRKMIQDDQELRQLYLEYSELHLDLLLLYQTEGESSMDRSELLKEVLYKASHKRC